MCTNYEARLFSYLLHRFKHNLEQRAHEIHTLTGADVSASIEYWIIKQATKSLLKPG
jgi:hypothetical protein